MCPLRLILLFLSATLAGFFLLKNLKSDDPSDFMDSNESSHSLQESSPSPSLSRSEKVKSAIGSGFWTCVDMASGRYLWRTLASSSSSSSSSKNSL